MPTINPIIKRAGTTQPDDGAYLNPDSRVGGCRGEEKQQRKMHVSWSGALMRAFDPNAGSWSVCVCVLVAPCQRHKSEWITTGARHQLNPGTS